MDSMLHAPTFERNALDSNELGELICRGRTQAASPVLLYVLAVLFFGIGAVLAVGTMPMVSSQLPSESYGGKIGVGVGLVMAMFGVLMFHSGRSKSLTHRVDFHENGVRIRGGSNDGERFYGELSCISVEIVRPGPRRSLKFVFLVLTHLLGAFLICFRHDGRVLTSHHYLFGGGEVSFSAWDEERLQVWGINYRKLESLAALIHQNGGAVAVDTVQAD